MMVMSLQQNIQYQKIGKNKLFAEGQMLHFKNIATWEKIYIYNPKP